MAYRGRASHMAVRARRAIYCDFSIRFGMRKTDGVYNKTGSSDLPVGRFVDRAVESYFWFSEKYFCFHAPQITSRTFRIPPHQRGVS